MNPHRPFASTIRATKLFRLKENFGRVSYRLITLLMFMKRLHVRRNRLPRWLTVALILYFGGAGVTGLDRGPPVHEDEPWIAAPGYSFWETGHFGTAMFGGFYGMEAHYYTFPP